MLLSLFWFGVCFETAVEMTDVAELPDLDFAEPLGAAHGVVAYSNLDDNYFSGEKNFFAGVYMGYKYQCVEYSRRYMMVTQGCIFGQCGPAYQLYAYTEVEHVETGEKYKWVACDNGKTHVEPAVGMTIIYPEHKKMPVGHVCSISVVEKDWIGIAEQNIESTSWMGRPYGRKVPLIRNADGTFYVKETDPSFVDCLGWLFIENGPKRSLLNPNTTEQQLSEISEVNHQAALYAPLRPLPNHISSAAPKSKLARFAVGLTNPLTQYLKSKPVEKLEGEPIYDLERRAIVEEYGRLLHQRFEETKASRAHHHSHPEHEEASSESPLNFRRAGTARSASWHSVYAPNEPLAIGSIGGLNSCFKIVEAVIKEYLAKEDPAKVSQLFQMPQFLVEAAKSHLCSASQLSIQLSTGDFVFGTMGLTYDGDVDAFRVTHTEFDSACNLIDVHSLQDQHSIDHGLARGWRMTNFGNDFIRAVKNIQKSVFHQTVVQNLPVVFLDFGSSDALEQRFGFKFPSASLKYQYDVEYLNLQYFYFCIEAVLDEKRKDFEAGDLLEKDLPKWSVNKVDVFSDDILIDGQTGNIIAGDPATTYRMAMKLAPWWAIFGFLRADNEKLKAKVEQFLHLTAASNHVYQPLWTHIVSHPQFLPILSRLAESLYAETDPRRLHIIPSSHWSGENDAAGRPKCTYKIKAFAGIIDPSNPAREDALVAADEIDHENTSKVFFPSTHCLVGGGKRSGAMALEGRTDDPDATFCTLYDLVHPAPMAFMPFLPGFHEADA